MEAEVELGGVQAPDKEHFIPCTREELVGHCLQEGKLSEEDGKKFQEFVRLLAAYYHFQFHDLLEELKAGYRPFEESEGGEDAAAANAEGLEEFEEQLIEQTEDILGRANFVPLEDATWERALTHSALLDLQTSVDTDDFERMMFYHQGRRQATIQVKRWFRERAITVNLFSRVVLFLKYREAAYFEARGVKVDKLSFLPGHIYVMLFRNVPLDDLELLLPNVKLSMGKRDRFMFLGPALAAGISVAIKAVPSLALILGAILFFTLGPSHAAKFGFAEEQASKIMPTLVAMLTVCIALGGFVWKQYSGYQNKRIKFMKRLTETLFFRNLAVGTNVFHAILDAAEEEETKEAILVYYHILLRNGEQTEAELHQEIERWLKNHIGLRVNFDIHQTLHQLHLLHAKLPGDSEPKALVHTDEAGLCHALDLAEAKQVLDRLWDDAFEYGLA